MLEPLGSALVCYQAVHLCLAEQEPSLNDLHRLAQRLMIVANKRSFQNALHERALRRRQCIQLRRQFSDLARLLDSSDATVVRTAQALGYAGFPDLRRELIEAVRGKATPALRLGRGLDSVDALAQRAD